MRLLLTHEKNKVECHHRLNVTIITTITNFTKWDWSPSKWGEIRCLSLRWHFTVIYHHYYLLCIIMNTRAWNANCVVHYSESVYSLLKPTLEVIWNTHTHLSQFCTILLVELPSDSFMYGGRYYSVKIYSVRIAVNSDEPFYFMLPFNLQFQMLITLSYLIVYSV